MPPSKPVTPPRLAKLTRPRMHSPVRRERLFRVLDKRASRPVVWVSGPPGSGKSVLVASYLEARKLEGWWLQVDEGDLDPATLFFYLNALARCIAPRRGSRLPYLAPEYLGDLAGFARRYFREFFGLFKAQAVLVLDNCQDAASESFHQILRVACAELPEALALVLVSREGLPEELSRAKAGGKVLEVGPEALRLTAKEAAAVATGAGCGRAQAEALNAQMEGWVAGLVLLLAGASDGARSPQAETDSHEALFAYFAGEVLSRAKPEVRAVLLMTSVVGEVTAGQAHALTGETHAGKVLEWLYRGQYFTERKLAGGEVSYRFHDLFRAFLEKRFEQAYGEAEQSEVRRRAACLLAQQGRASEAVGLFRRAEDWAALGAVVKQHAREVIEAGRWRTLLEWLEAMPEGNRTSDPWLAFWEACARGQSGDAGAPDALERSYEAFVRSGDSVGQFAVARAMIDTCTILGSGFSSVYRWSSVIAELLPRVGPQTSPLEVLRAWQTITTTYVLRHLEHPLVDEGVSFLTDALFSTTLPVNDRVLTGAALLAYCWPTGDMALFERVSARVREVATDAGVGPFAKLSWFGWRMHVVFVDGRFDDARSDAATFLEVAREYGFAQGAVLAYAYDCLAACARIQGDLEQAERHTRAIEDFLAEDRPFIRYLATSHRIQHALKAGDLAAALPLAERVDDVTEAAGYGPVMSFLRLIAASVFIRSGRLQDAQRILDREGTITAVLPPRHSRALLLATQASWYLAIGASSEALACFENALQAAELPGQVAYLGLLGDLGDLCAFAARHGTEVERVKRAIRTFRLPPPDEAGPEWPFPVRIRVLGPRRMFVEDQPIQYGRKVPRRLLALLDLLVAAGRSGMARDHVIDSLWPDTDGDAADNALKIAVKRLRSIFGRGDLVVVKQGRLWLNSQCVWVDAWAFEAALADDGGRSMIARAERGLPLYEGELLAGEAPPLAAVITARERLRALFLRAVHTLGSHLEAEQRWPDAKAWYERGVRAEPLHELSYLGLMRCLRAEGALEEARKTYRTLESVLQSAFGAPPSAAAVSLRRQLDQAR